MFRKLESVKKNTGMFLIERDSKIIETFIDNSDQKYRRFFLHHKILITLNASALVPIGFEWMIYLDVVTQQ